MSNFDVPNRPNLEIAGKANREALKGRALESINRFRGADFRRFAERRAALEKLYLEHASDEKREKDLQLRDLDKRLEAIQDKKFDSAILYSFYDQRHFRSSFTTFNQEVNGLSRDQLKAFTKQKFEEQIGQYAMLGIATLSEEFFDKKADLALGDTDENIDKKNKFTLDLRDFVKLNHSDLLNFTLSKKGSEERQKLVLQFESTFKDKYYFDLLKNLTRDGINDFLTSISEILVEEHLAKYQLDENFELLFANKDKSESEWISAINNELAKINKSLKDEPSLKTAEEVSQSVAQPGNVESDFAPMQSQIDAVSNDTKLIFEASSDDTLPPNVYEMRSSVPELGSARFLVQVEMRDGKYVFLMRQPYYDESKLSTTSNQDATRVRFVEGRELDGRKLREYGKDNLIAGANSMLLQYTVFDKLKFEPGFKTDFKYLQENLPLSVLEFIAEEFLGRPLSERNLELSELNALKELFKILLNTADFGLIKGRIEKLRAHFNVIGNGLRLRDFFMRLDSAHLKSLNFEMVDKFLSEKIDSVKIDVKN